MNLFSKLVASVSDHPVLFLFFRSLLENDFSAIRALIGAELRSDNALRTLDLGCGPGAFARHFPPKSYLGIDVNPRYIDYAQRHFHGEFAVGDARRLNLPDRCFDQALIFGLLHHVDDTTLRSILGECRRVLSDKGTILVIEDIPVISRLNVIGHLIHKAENGRHIRSADEYRALYRESFRIEKEYILASGLCDYYAAVLRF